MILARQMTGELQQKAEEFRDQNTRMEEEKKKLDDLPEQLAPGIKRPEQKNRRLEIKK